MSNESKNHTHSTTRVWIFHSNQHKEINEDVIKSD